MSLTRAQWVEMWQDIKRVEAVLDQENYVCNDKECPSDECKALSAVISRTKDKIESVIGQMRTTPDEL